MVLDLFALMGIQMGEECDECPEAKISWKEKVCDQHRHYYQQDYAYHNQALWKALYLQVVGKACPYQTIQVLSTSQTFKARPLSGDDT